MSFWVPEKWKIEKMLAEIQRKLENAKTVAEVEEWVTDQLCSLESHIYNRAGIERGDIKE